MYCVCVLYLSMYCVCAVLVNVLCACVCCTCQCILCRNDASQTQLTNHCKQVAEQISNLVQAVRHSMQSPDSPSAQLILINSSQAMIPVSGWGGGERTIIYYLVTHTSKSKWHALVITQVMWYNSLHALYGMKPQYNTGRALLALPRTWYNLCGH